MTADREIEVITSEHLFLSLSPKGIRRSIGCAWTNAYRVKFSGSINFLLIISNENTTFDMSCSY